MKIGIVRGSAVICFLALVGLLLAGCSKPQESSQKVRIGMIPKLKGIEYFNACEKGAKEAAAELGVELIYDGPLANDVTRQTEMINAWALTRRMAVIAVSPNDPRALAPALKGAMQQGARVLTWDADADPDSRNYFVNQATYEEVGNGLVDIMADQVGPKGQVAVVTGSLTAANQNNWMEWMKKRIAAKYPELQLVAVKPSEEYNEMATQVTKELLKEHPDLKGIFAITSVAFPAVAGAVRDAGLGGKVAVVGLSTPNSMKPYVHDGTVKTVLLWNPVDLGYLTVYAAKALAEQGTLPEKLAAGRLGTVQVRDNQVLLGPPFRFTKENIDQFDF